MDNEFVMVPRDVLSDYLQYRDNGNWYDGIWVTHAERLRALLAQPAAQHQGDAIGTLARDADEKVVFTLIGDPHIKDGMPVFAEQKSDCDGGECGLGGYCGGCPKIKEQHQGDSKLVDSIRSLLALDAAGALVPHGIGGLARELLESSAIRLSVQPHGEPVAWFTDDHLTDKSATTWDSTIAERWREKGWPVSQLFTQADTGEVERLSEKCDHLTEANRILMDDCDTLRAERDGAIKLLGESVWKKIEDMRAQLAERDALLLSIYNTEPLAAETSRRIETALSASAEPNIKESKS